MTAAADALLDPAKALHPENVAHNARALNYIRSSQSQYSESNELHIEA